MELRIWDRLTIHSSVPRTENAAILIEALRQYVDRMDEAATHHATGLDAPVWFSVPRQVTIERKVKVARNLLERLVALSGVEESRHE